MSIWPPICTKITIPAAAVTVPESSRSSSSSSMADVRFWAQLPGMRLMARAWRAIRRYSSRADRLCHELPRPRGCRADEKRDELAPP